MLHKQLVLPLSQRARWPPPPFVYRSSKLAKPQRVPQLSSQPMRLVSCDVSSTWSPGTASYDDPENSDLTWLSRFPPFSDMAESTLQDLTAAMREVSLPPGAHIAVSGEPAIELIVVRKGQVQEGEGDGQGQVHGAGSVFHLRELLLGRSSRAAGASSTITCTGNAVCPVSLTAKTHVTVWLVPAQVLQGLVATHRAEFALALTRVMANLLEAREAEVEGSQARARALAPYLVSAPRRGVVGASTYAERLRKQVLAAARNTARPPVLVFGEPGLGKNNIGALIHFGSGSRGAPMVRLSCERLQNGGGAELWGRGGKQGLLGLLQGAPPGAALLLDDVHLMPPTMLPKLAQLLKEGSWRALPPVGSGSARVGNTEQPLQSFPPGSLRVILTAEKAVPAVEALVSSIIKVPPLRLRPADIGPLATYYLSHGIRHGGVGLASGSSSGTSSSSANSGPPVRMLLSAAVIRRMQAYPWPGNEEELRTTVERAAQQQVQQATAATPAAGGAAGQVAEGAAGTTAAGQAQSQTKARTPGGLQLGHEDVGTTSAKERQVVLAEELVWFGGQQSRERLRLDLLRVVPGLRSLLRSSLWPEDINFKFTVFAFPIIVAMLLFGPQDRDHNAILNVFWCWWWPGIFLVYPFLGRIWCSVCPFMIYGEVVQRWRLAQGAVLAKWPRGALDKFGPWFLYGLFAAILVWEEVWDLPHSAALSGWLLLLITAGAVVCSTFFERRLWCRYLCPIGGMNGLFAKGAMTELRARQGVCAGNCNTYHCYKGGCAEPPEGQETTGCPLYSHPAQLQDNKNCTLCMTCLKACPHNSVEFRLRLPGSELWQGHEPSWAELALLSMLAGAVPLHSLEEGAGRLAQQLGLSSQLVGDVSLSHIVISFAFLAAPTLFVVGTDVACRKAAAPLAGTRQPAPLLNLGYGYLPLVWAATLAHYEAPFMSEGGRILQVAGAMVGLGPFTSYLPGIEAHPAVVSFVQGVTLLVGWGASLALTRKIAAAPWASIWPHALVMTGSVAELWYLNITSSTNIPMQ